MHVHVMKSNGLRSGRGFSLPELEQAGVSIHQVRHLGIFVDSRRMTAHEFNVQTLKTLIEEKKRQLEEEKKKREEQEKKVRGKAEKEKKKKEKKEKGKEKKEARKKEKEEEREEAVGITELKGVGEKKAEKFKAAGISTVEDLLNADAEELAEKTGFTADYIESLKEKADSP